MATVGIVFVRHDGDIRSIEIGRLLRHPAHPCNTLAEDLVLWLGLHPDPASGLTYRQFAEKLIEAKVGKDDLRETFYYVARTAKEALEIYQADDTPMNFTAAVRHRKALKLLGLWRSVT